MKFQNITGNVQRINDFYHFYKKYFPPMERDTLSNIKRLIQNASTVSEWEYTIVEVLDKEEKVGGIIYDWFSDINVLIIEFVFIAEAYRHRKIAKRLVERLKHKIPNTTILIEVEKNGFAKTFWEKMDFSIVSDNYIQPPISKNQKSFDGLVLMSNKPVKNLKDILKNHYWKYSFLN